MRPTLSRAENMPGRELIQDLCKAFKHFGNTERKYSNHAFAQNLWWGDNRNIRQKGITQYTISPWQTKSAPQMFRSYLFNGYRRLSGEFIFWAIPFGIAYGIYSWAKSYDKWQNSKEGHIASGTHH
ncbi:Cytochrome b-c1 complex subunit 8 [Leucoagaricus sp. SymC.cos]|nr:Cytochrome b-c1 complex subunit 8 [Leucoagaricus sp. SymC.cos]